MADLQRQETPQWIELVYAPQPGRDHLGLVSVASGYVLEQLSPGIIVQTVHPRYFSFYAFIVDEFWRRGFNPDRQSFQQFYRYCELVYSVGCHRCGRPTHGEMGAIVGASMTRGWAESGLDPLAPDLPYIETDLGGYRLYYRGRMQEFGLILAAGTAIPTKDGGVATYNVDICTADIGEPIAAAFRDAVRGTRFYQEFLGSFDPVPLQVAAEFAEAGCLCAIHDVDAPDRPKLMDLHMHGGVRPEDRRATLRYLLDLAHGTDGHEVDQRTFRRLVYFGSDGQGLDFHPRPETMDAHRGWRLYQAREYYAFALNTLWAWLCDWGVSNDGDRVPLEMAQIRRAFVDSGNPNLVATALELDDPGLGEEASWSDVVAWFAEKAEATSAVRDDRGILTNVLNEEALLEVARSVASPGRAAAAVGLLALITARFGDPALRSRREWVLARMGEEDRPCLDGFFRDVERWGAAGPLSLRDFLTRLLERYVIAQHILIASHKMPENTFRFERDGTGLRFYKHDNPVEFSDSRFFALTTHLHDLGLCGDFTAGDHSLTRDGLRLLETGDLN